MEWSAEKAELDCGESKENLKCCFKWVRFYPKPQEKYKSLNVF